MSNFYLAIAEEISNQFRGCKAWPKNNYWSSTYWTNKIKAAMIAINKDPNIELRFTERVDKQNKNWEFLYDFIFLYTGKNSVGDGYFKNEHIIQKVVAVVESEFNGKGNDILYDFSKLLIAKADLRVMVFWSKNNLENKSVLCNMLRMIATFQQSDGEDLYLLCWFDHDLWNFSYSLINGAGKTLKEWW